MTKIAIIEDDAAINQMYRMKFEAEGFDVRMAADGAQGVEIVKDFEPDVILLDLQMPHMDGATALDYIRKMEKHKNTPVLILTNLGEEEAPVSLKKLGVSSYIVKANYTPKQVVAKVKEFIH